MTNQVVILKISYPCLIKHLYYFNFLISRSASNAALNLFTIFLISGENLMRLHNHYWHRSHQQENNQKFNLFNDARGIRPCKEIIKIPNYRYQIF